MTLNALLTSAEGVFGARIRALAIARTHHWRQFRFKMKANHFSFSVSVGELNPLWLCRQLDVSCCSVHSAQLWMRLWILTMQRRQFDYIYICGSDGRIIIECSMNTPWSDVAILAFTFCSSLVCVKHGRKTVLSWDNCRLAQWAWLKVWHIDSLNANWHFYKST